MAIRSIPNRTILSFSACSIETLYRFFQNLITNDIHKLNTNNLLATAFLNLKGRVLFEGFLQLPVQSTENNCPSILLDIDKSVENISLSHLKSYLLRPEEIKIENVSDYYSTVISDEKTSQLPLFEDPRSRLLGYRAIIFNQLKIDTSLTYDPIYSLKRILLGCPELPFDIVSGSSLPFDCNMDNFNYVDFHKGCYLGQELTIRTKHQGVIRRRYIPIQLTSTPQEPLFIPASLSHSDISAYLENFSDTNYRSYDSMEFSGGKLISSLCSIGLARIKNDFLHQNEHVFPVLLENNKVQYIRPVLKFYQVKDFYCK